MASRQAFNVPVTITEAIYQYLKKAIIHGNLKPQQRLQEKEIAELFQASTTPVREAFQRLFAEKYIVIKARKDVVVASATLEEIREFFEVVRVLDALASKKAVRRLSNKDIAEIKSMTEKLGVYYQKRKISDYVAENLKIHCKIWQACGNKYLEQSLVEMGEKHTFYGNQLFFIIFDRQAGKQPSFLDSSYKDHVDLMQAIERRDELQVEKILLAHWGKGFLGEEET